MKTEKTPFRTYSNGYTFRQAKSFESRVPSEKIKQALDFFFRTDGQLQKADDETDRSLGIDYYYYLADGRKVSIDLKIRQTNHKKLVVETRWLNCDKKAWIETSQSDYFLFVHTDYQTFDFYIVSASDLRELVEECEPRLERAWIDRNNTVAIMYYYEYDDLTKIKKKYAKTSI